ncbi:uncharacterized protein LOC108234754 [Kryptolebias marmoratus]|uniref:uncharacterized protein LOC108234754 n=1 Tax=Kryptolebias marmoratus TaxID=37003 RepID=UPI0007F87280|nr:uncharacterized protein LOC108234754 [Kryptolebias marmoratus]
MRDGFELNVLLRGLTLLLLSAACGASSLGLAVHVVPLDGDGGKTVRAHFTVITPSPCPDLSEVCAAGEDCEAHRTPLPYSYTKPSPGWCVRQWQKTVPSDYSAMLRLGPSAQFYVSINAEPKIRANNGKLNQPAYLALPPPLRARQNCPVDFHLSAKDLDGDKVRCRFARADKGECLSCTQHAFITLDEDKCILSFTGNAEPGHYFIYLMAEDLIPVPKISRVTDITPLSSVPLHLSLSVEEWTSSCSNEPKATDGTPEKHSVLFVMPFQEVKFSTNYKLDLESVLEVAAVGPPDLYRVGFVSIGPLATMTMAWVRSENNQTRLLPICFVSNTQSLQSELRCVWLYQRQMRTLPAGTELTCDNTEMTLVLPVTSFTGINLAELQLNSPTCPVSYNNTHLTAHIPLNGCGTKAVHSGSELVYTNTLKSVPPYSMIRRSPILMLPLACRIPGVQVRGPQYAVGVPTERETFGDLQVWIEFHLPGQGPLAKFTSKPRFRSNFQARKRRQAEIEPESKTARASGDNIVRAMELGSRVKQLDLYVMSNCSVDRAEMIVRDCTESDTKDFAESRPILKDGCMSSNSTLEVVTEKTNSKVYRLDMDAMATTGTTMYVQCNVHLCIATMPSDKCPDLCTRTGRSSTLVGSVFTSEYKIRSGPVSLVLTTAAPAVSTSGGAAPTILSTMPNTALTTETKTSSLTPKTTTKPITGTTIPPTSINTASNSTSRAPEMATAMTPGVILTAICIFFFK